MLAVGPGLTPFAGLHIYEVAPERVTKISSPLIIVSSEMDASISLHGHSQTVWSITPPFKLITSETPLEANKSPSTVVPTGSL